MQNFLHSNQAHVFLKEYEIKMYMKRSKILIVYDNIAQPLQLKKYQDSYIWILFSYILYQSALN